MSALPAPLTPADADLRDFPFMPLMVQRLMQSRAWMLCSDRPELAYFLINLWAAAWHSKPAASLENDNMVLAHAAKCSKAKFVRLRADLMRGWVECSDGRLYHPVVAEQACGAWERKIAQRARTDAARAARDAKRRDAVTSSVTEDATDAVTASKGQGQGQGHLKDTRPRAPSRADGPTVDFGGGMCWPETSVRSAVARWREDPSTWPGDRLGPPPGVTGCRVPEHLIQVAA